jgi:hypothetical protein
MTRRLAPSELPDWPRRMAAQLAAAYIGVSPSKFLAGVKAGRYPAGVEDGGNRLWYRSDLDRWLDQARDQAAASPAGEEPPADEDDTDAAMMEAIRAGNQAQARKRRAA